MADRDRRNRGRSRSRSTSRDRERTNKTNREREEVKEVKDSKTIDREKTCPLLLRVFCSQGRHHRIEEFSRSGLPPNELQVYTWKDATLKELMSLVKEVNSDGRQKGTVFSFATVFPDHRRGGFIMKEIGSTTAGHKGPDDVVTLESKKFQIGDYIDVCIQTPRMGRRDRPY